MTVAKAIRQLTGQYWSYKKAAILGALFGAAYTLLRPLITDAPLYDPPPADAAGFLIGTYLGAMIGGAFMFSVIAWIKNYFAK